MPVTSPSTGQVTGQLHTRLSVGTASQISNLMESERSCVNGAGGRGGGNSSVPAGVDWRCIDFVRWPLPTASGHGCCASSASLENDNDCTSLTEENVCVSGNSVK